MNFNVDENLFSIPEVWDGLTASQHRAMTIVFNQIVHWSRVAKHCELREGQIERLYRIPRKDIVAARERLLDLKLIKCMRLYNRLTNQPAVYSGTTGLWQIIKKPVVNMTKPVVSGTMDNNYNNNYRGIDDVNTSPTPNERMLTSTDHANETKPNPLVEEYQRLNKKQDQ